MVGATEAVGGAAGGHVEGGGGGGAVGPYRAQIQRKNSVYQGRIEALTRELIVAKDESRELIHARITPVKAEMEAARARMVAQTESGGEGGA